MSDLNDLSKPTPTDTEPNVLDTLRAHIIRAATWSGWGGTTSKVAGIMSAVTATVSGGRSLRLYRRNDANTSDEEIVSLPGVSIGGNAATAGSANAVAWSGVSGKPSTVAGYGITDMGGQTVSHASTAGSANAAPWSGVWGKPNTVGGYGITDMGSQSVNYAASAGNAANVSNVTTAQVLTATSGAGAGGVGSYAFAKIAAHSAYDSSFGATRPGGSLIPTSAAAVVSGNPSLAFLEGGSLTGTWRCLGYGDYEVSNGAGAYMTGATLWLRIA